MTFFEILGWVCLGLQVLIGSAILITMIVITFLNGTID